jgi:ASC-1-like (ASCH) protein
MRHLIGLCVVALVLMPAQSSQAAFKGCYERVYSKAYLKKNPKQTFIKMRFQFGVAQGDDVPFELMDQISVVLRDKKIYESVQAVCREEGKGLRCGLESDAGSFDVIDRGRNSIRVTLGDYLQLGDYEKEAPIKIDRHNKEFRLYRISKSACP